MICSTASERTDTRSGESNSRVSYYISSLEAKPAVIAKAIRSHWAIENNLHWTMDVIFGEDAALKKKVNTALNYQIITKMALAIIERESQSKLTKPKGRQRAALDDKFRSTLLAAYIYRRFPCKAPSGPLHEHFVPLGYEQRFDFTRTAGPPANHIG